MMFTEDDPDRRGAIEREAQGRAAENPDALLEAMAHDVGFNPRRAESALAALGWPRPAMPHGKAPCCLAKHYAPKMTCRCDLAQQRRNDGKDE